MSARIIPFPDRGGANLSKIESKIRACLQALTDDAALVADVAPRLMSFITKYATRTFEPVFNLPLPPLPPEQRQAFLLALEAGVDGIAEQVYDMINRIVMERLYREIEIYETAQGSLTGQTLDNICDIIECLPGRQGEKAEYLRSRLQRPQLTPPEKYLLNKLLQAALADKLAQGSARRD